MSKKILGVEVIKQLGITTAELLKRMKSGRLKATTIDGDKVSRNQRPDQRDPLRDGPGGRLRSATHERGGEG